MVKVMSDLNGFDFSQMKLPTIDTSGIARQFQAQNAEMNAMMDEIAEHNRKKDEALFQTAEASIEQQKLLEQQLETVKVQNQQLKENNALLKNLYESAKKEAESGAADAKASMRLAWISIIIGAVIGIAGVVVGIIF